MVAGSSAIFFPSLKPHLPFNLCCSSSPSFSSSSLRHPPVINIQPRPLKSLIFPPSSRTSLSLSPPFAVAEVLEQAADISDSPRGASSHRVDKSGRFCSPRAARELALLVGIWRVSVHLFAFLAQSWESFGSFVDRRISNWKNFVGRLIAYAACLEGSDPVRLLDKRINAKREPGFAFDKAALLRYDHMSFGGAPVEAGTEEEAEELMLKNERDSANEAEVLSAPPKLVYNRFVLRLTRQILGAVVDRWNQHVIVIDKIIPQSWKDQPAARILELCILHLAMAEITVMGTRHQIVINEAVDLAKRFCDGCAPRIINGCLRTFVKDFSAMDAVQS